MNHELYFETLNENDSDKITNNIIKIVNDVSHNLCPTKKTKININNNNKINNELKEAIKNKNEAYINMIENKTQENRNDYKNMKATVQRVKRKLYNDNESKDYENAEGNQNKMWKIVKTKIYPNEIKPFENIFYKK